MNNRKSILSICLLLLALPELAILAHVGQPTAISQPNNNITNDIPLTQDVATLIGVVNVAALPAPSGSLDQQALSLPSLLPSQSTQAQQADPAFTVLTVSSGSSFIHIQKSIAGTPGTNPNPCVCSPPDMGLGASFKFVVQMVNLAGTIYRTDGSTVKTFALSDFWFLPTRGGPLVFGMSDPAVLFDARAGRWFASIIDTFDVNRVRFAVTATDDPTGVWFIYNVRTPSSTTLPDQPLIGYSDDKFLIAANDFTFDPTFTTASFLGAQYWILNSPEMFAGNRFIDMVTNTPSPSDFRITPVSTLSSTANAFLVENCLTVTPAVLSNNCSTSSTGGGVIVFTVTGTPPGTTTVTPTTVPVHRTGFPRRADQPGNPASLGSNNAARILNAVWQNNLLWVDWNDGNNGGSCSTPSCVRLVEIATPVTATSTPLQDFDFVTAGPGSTFYGAVSLDTNNNLVVIYGTSSLTVFPTLQVTGQQSTAPADTLNPSRTLAAGTAADLSTRFGDYFSAATEPNVPSTFWVSGEYRQISLFEGWSTQVGEVTFTSA